MRHRTKPTRKGGGRIGFFPVVLILALAYLLLSSVASSLGDSQLRRLINPPAQPTPSLPGAVIPTAVPTIDPSWPWERDVSYGEALTYWRNGTEFLVVHFSEESKTYNVDGKESMTFSQTVFVRGNIEMVERYNAMNASVITDKNGDILFWTRFDSAVDGRAPSIHVIANVGSFQP